MKIELDFDELINEAAKIDGGQTRIEALLRARQQIEELQTSHENATKEIDDLRSRSLKDQVALEELRRINGDIVSRLTVKTPDESFTAEQISSMFKFKG